MESLGGWMNKTNGLGIWIEFLVQRDADRVGLSDLWSMQKTWSRGILKNMCFQPVWGVLCLPDHLPTPVQRQTWLGERLHHCMFVIMYVLLSLLDFFPVSSIWNFRFSYLFLFHFPPDMYVKCPFFFSILNLLNFFSCQRAMASPVFRCPTLF